jgi:hypothetical protein
MSVEARYLSMWLLGASVLGWVREEGKERSAADARTLESDKLDRARQFRPQRITTLPSPRQEPRRGRY